MPGLCLVLLAVSVPFSTSLVVSLSHLVVGLVVAWWLWSGDRRSASRTSSAMLPTAKAEVLLRQVNGVVSGIFEGVGAYSTSMESVTQELRSLCQEGRPVVDGVERAVAQIMQANQTLQTRLTSAEASLRQQAQVIEAYMAEARTDALTNLPNRRALDDELKTRFAEWRRERRPLAIMLIDIDHFKKINDQYGHLMGDAVLAGIAQALAKSLREKDFLARYGGEEFFAILPDTDQKSAMLTAELARRNVRSCTFVAMDLELGVTVSVGVAQAVNVETAEKLLERADRAMYAAKHNGRDNSHCHDGFDIHPVQVRCVEPKRWIYQCGVNAGLDDRFGHIEG